MPLSSSSFFHFTDTVEAFKSILASGFRISPSIEIRSKFEEIPKGTAVTRTALAVPMVCFCDIPISLVKAHVDSYGKETVFGFGLKRSWGIEKKCEPVIYGQDSDRYQNISDALSILLRDGESKISDVYWRDVFFLAYTNVELNTRLANGGSVARNMWLPKTDLLYKLAFGDNYGRDSFPVPKVRNYHFYNEREWRFVPKDVSSIPYYRDFDIKHELLSEPTLGGELEIEQYAWFKEESSKLRGMFPNLTFNVEDVTFLIVDNDETLKDMVGWILDPDNSSIGGTESADLSSRYLLVSKLISYETIKSDIFHM